ncbi:ATP synthase, delta/epsilon subunit, beta-sandwich domain protein [Ostertagia ostertagi]
MELEILTPVKKLFSDTVYGVQLPGIGGSFEVLDKHAPLVSALKAVCLAAAVGTEGQTALANASPPMSPPRNQ